MDLSNIKDIASIITPLTKIVFETFLLPKFQEFQKKMSREGKVIDQYFENKFIDYLDELYEKCAILNTVAFKKRQVWLHDVYIPLKLRCEETKEELKIDVFSDDLFKNSNKILITDTAGMGKSTLSKKLLLSCIEMNKGVPILIELRRLSKNKGIIEEILEQLNPINETLDKQFILDLVKRGDFIFFLDGFDEIQLNERAKVTSEIQQFTTKANKNRFVLTSRPENALTSFGDFLKFQIRPLNSLEAFDLLRKYDQSGELSELLIKKLKESSVFPNIKEYLTTPLLVSLLYTAFEHKQTIPFKKHIFYRQVFDALYDSHDLSKGDSFERDKHSGLGIDDFLRILRIFGYLCLVNGNQIEFTRDQLEDIISKAIKYCGDIKVKPSDFIKDLIITVPIFSLDGVYYKWSHKSLQEYFASQFIYLDAKDKQNEILLKICFHESNELYLNIIDLYESIDPRGFKNIVLYKLLQDFTKHMKVSYKNFPDSKSKLERQQLAFIYDLYLINFPFEPRTRENSPSEIFELLRNLKGKKRMSIGMNVVPDENQISCIKVPRIINPQLILLNFLDDKDYSFVTRIKMKPSRHKIDLKLKSRHPYSVTDRKNSYLNTLDNFEKTNDIIKHFLARHEVPVINQKKASIALSEIQESIKSSSDENFLLTF
ncbi:hypothetical protein J2X31_001793 [Flavobacterium arsenatis]|uniref:NACHT domain-containing protein n=1 Tax=Flavobacterium arsenatis TaxID=1484332 RepID=A0ABU1TPG1_9FLAO|nr:NACHT domain-containing protein [Flavobacterium arsenatis]MDR6967781.1 hypothetical protein [Flavobacterium arsenatis]